MSLPTDSAEEAQIHDQGDYTCEDLMQYLTCGGMMDPVEASTFVLRNAKEPGFIEKTIAESKAKTLAKWGILCLSRCPDDILMWSHYCASHTGFVLGFDVLKCPAFFVLPLNINYQLDYPSYHYLREADKIVSHGIATKSQQWNYEQEVRVIKTPPGAHQFAPECLVQIIFGARMAEPAKVELMSYLRHFGFAHTEVWQGSCSRTAYKLDLQRLA